LTMLSLRRTGVTDIGLTHLKKLTTLRQLDVSDTKVTEPGIHQLQQARPDIELIRDD
jgi:hypothetical protein